LGGWSPNTLIGSQIVTTVYPVTVTGTTGSPYPPLPPANGITVAQTNALIAAQVALDSLTYAARIFLAQDADGVYFPAQSAGMAVDSDGTYYYAPGFSAVATVAIDADGTPYPVAIGA
jgi:hypothetical protein